MVLMSHDLQDRVVVITDASSAIGDATARLLAENGARVVLGAPRATRLYTLAAEIEANGGTALCRAVDVTDADDVEALVYFAKNRFGQVDVIFNNAGVRPLSPIADVQLEDWNRMIDVNIRGVLNGIAAALPIFREQGHGHVINTANAINQPAPVSGTVYNATKYAVWAISDGLRQENSDIRVTTVSPGKYDAPRHGTAGRTNANDNNGISHAIPAHGHRDAMQSAPNRFDVLSDNLAEFRQSGLSPIAIAWSVLYAISQPEETELNELIIRPTADVY